MIRFLHDKAKTIRSKRPASGQSLVEFVLLLPVLLIMISGLIEFGFMLNFYLDLIDTAREVARLAADDDPVHNDVGNFEASPLITAEPHDFYYERMPNATNDLLNRAGQISLDQANGDDLVVSVFATSAGTVTGRYPPAYTEPGGYPYPGCAQGGENGWRWHCNQASKFSTTDIEGRLDSTAPDTGLVLVEIYYHYEMALALPWITAFVPNPVQLHAYSIMPNSSATP